MMYGCVAVSPQIREIPTDGDQNPVVMSANGLKENLKRKVCVVFPIKYRDSQLSDIDIAIDIAIRYNDSHRYRHILAILVVWNMTFIFPYIGKFIIPTD